LASIDALDIEKSENEIPKEYNYIDKTYYKVPNVVGMSVSDAVKELKSFKVEYSGSGEIITYQSPASGTQIYEGETIRLLLSE